MVVSVNESVYHYGKGHSTKGIIDSGKHCIDDMNSIYLSIALKPEIIAHLMHMH